MRRKHFLIGAASAMLLIPLAVCVLTAMALLQMLHMPRNVIADAPGAQVVSIQAADRITLKAAWTPASRIDSCVMVLHGVGGWRGRSQRFLPWLLPAGYSVLAPDLRAHGESGGDTVTYGIFERQDTLDWAAWLRQQGCQRVYGMGESLGASILIMAAGMHPDQHVFEAIVAECPFADLLQAAEQRGQKLLPFPAFVARPLAKLAVSSGNLYTRVLEDLDFRQSSPVESIRALQIPILLIHGLDDTRTPPSHSQELAAANRDHTELWLVPEARHVRAYTTAPAEYRERVLTLFAAR